MVLDAHARDLPVPATGVGALLDRLGRPDDPRWPSRAWPPMVLSGLLAPGVAGGPGPSGDTATGDEPGRPVEFAVAPGVGLHGTHTLSIEPARHDRCVLRHVLAVRLRRSGRVTWLVVRWLHDAAVEDLLHRAESSLGVGPARPTPWSCGVRMLPRLRRLPSPEDARARRSAHTASTR